MAAKPKYYVETTVIIELLEQPPTADLCRALWQILEDAERGKCEVFTSTLTMVEVTHVEREKKAGKADPAVRASKTTRPPRITGRAGLEGSGAVTEDRDGSAPGER